MSYSFTVRGADKQAAKDAVKAAFDKVVEQQPIHARDRDVMLANAAAVIDLLGDDADRDIAVNCSGYVSWRGDADGSTPLVGARADTSASYIARLTTE